MQTVKSIRANFSTRAAIVTEVITKRQARIQLDHPGGREIFEYDDTSERRDQLRNALMQAKDLVEKKIAVCLVDGASDPRVAICVEYVGGRFAPKRTPLSGSASR